MNTNDSDPLESSLKWSQIAEDFRYGDAIEVFIPHINQVNRAIDIIEQKECAELIELGSGTGLFYKMLKARLPDVKYLAGVDFAPGMVWEAKRRTDGNYVHADMIEYLRGLEDDSQECIVAIDSAHCLHDGIRIDK